jgi:hypothetical protein
MEFIADVTPIHSRAAQDDSNGFVVRFWDRTREIE